MEISPKPLVVIFFRAPGGHGLTRSPSSSHKMPINSYMGWAIPPTENWRGTLQGAVRVTSTSKSTRTPAFLPTEGTPPIRSSHDHPPRRLRVAGDEVAPDLGSQRPNQGLLPLDLSPAQHPCAASTAATRHRSGSGMGKVRKGAWKAIWSEWEARRAPRVMSPPGRTRRRPMGSGGTGEGERRRGVFRGERGLVCGPGGGHGREKATQYYV
jgi:hypothetical protein